MPRIKTEKAWLNSTTPHSLLLTLKGKRLPRQRRLFAVACSRRWLSEMLDPESRNAVDVAERYADDLADYDELASAYRAAQVAASERFIPARFATEGSDAARLWRMWFLAHIAQVTCDPNGSPDVLELSRGLLKQGAGLGSELENPERRVQCVLVHDIFGNPFRSQPAIDSSLLSWNDRTILKLAQAIYDDRAFDRLPILADALEEAGCTNVDMLNHCRLPGEHVRGCWVVDLLLGKR